MFQKVAYDITGVKDGIKLGLSREGIELLSHLSSTCSTGHQGHEWELQPGAEALLGLIGLANQIRASEVSHTVWVSAC